MSTKIRRIPNVFESLYRLAKHDNYDALKWKEILTGICRKTSEKHSIRDMCLLYYSLFKAHNETQLSQLQLWYRQRNKNPRDLNRINANYVNATNDVNELDDNAFQINSKTHNEDTQSADSGYLGPLTINDVADAYLDNVANLIKYMNSKQLAIISKYLLMFKKLNEPLCSLIVSKIGSNRLKMTTRSFCNIILALSESNHVSRDLIEMLLLQNASLLMNMNKIDLLYILKVISIHKINNEHILNIISERLDYYAEDLVPNELVTVLNLLYKLNWCNQSTLLKLYFKIQNTLNKFNLQSLVSISRCLSHFNIKNVSDFFDSELIPLAHQMFGPKLKSDSNQTNPTESQLAELSDSNHMQFQTLDHVLLLYNYCYNSGSTSFPALVDGVLADINLDYQWHLLFKLLHRYQQNIDFSASYLTQITSNIRKRPHITGTGGVTTSTTHSDHFDPNTDSNSDLIEYLKLVSRSNGLFNSYMDSNAISIKYLPDITRFMVESGFDSDDVLLQIISGIETDDLKLAEYLLEVLFNLHTVCFDDFNAKYDELLSCIPTNRTDYMIRLMSILFYRNIIVPSETLSLFRSLFGSVDKDNGAMETQTDSINSQNINTGVQNESWQLPPVFSEKSHKRVNIELSDRDLEYLLYSMVFPVSNGPCSNKNGLNESANAYMNTVTNRIAEYLNEMFDIFRRIKRFERPDLMNVFLYCIGQLDPNLLTRLLGSDSTNSSSQIAVKSHLPHHKAVSGNDGQHPYVNHVAYAPITLEVVPIATVPSELSSLKHTQVDSFVLKTGDDLLFNPCYLAKDTGDVYCHRPSREKWDSISINMLRTILGLHSYHLKFI